MNKIFFSKIEQIYANGYLVKFISELKDELIAFVDNETKEIKIYSSICPHFGGEIFYSKKDNCLKCKWHAWKFCKNTGKCLTFPIKGSLNLYTIIKKKFRVTEEKFYPFNLKIIDINLFYICHIKK